MTKEHLKRTPTSSGNQKVWTWSGWVKLSDLSVVKPFFGAFFGGGSRYTLVGTNVDGKLQMFGGDYDITNNSTSYNTWKLSTNLFRDCGSWMHVIAAYNTTVSSAEKRFNMYVNGEKLTLQEYNSGNATPSQNSLTYINSPNAHFIGAWGPQADTANQSYEGEMFDVFLVDGQALTPDVFGFHKTNTGYMSVGSTQATKFKKGAWTPKDPKIIKSNINARGGFGVNGFYLPMNSSNNPGADFHCTPNSILKLKEDLPQPKAEIDGGANYAGSLRNDPFKDYLVLAVPGVLGGKQNGYGDYSADIKGSGSNKIFTANGNATVSATASYYGSAMTFDGTGDHFRTTSNLSDFHFGTGDFTVEAWIFKSANGNSGYDGLIALGQNGSANDGWFLEISDTRGILFAIGSNYVQHNIDVNKSQWQHVAVERYNGRTTIYYNGVAVVNGTTLGSPATTGTVLDIGAYGLDGVSGEYYFNGRIQDVRVYKGVAKYKGGFDVPKPYTPVGIEAFRTTTDTCKNNFATLNSLYLYGSANTSYSSNITLSNGNLTAAWTSGSGSNQHARSTFAMLSGKWYFETRMNALSGGDVGVAFEKHINDSVGYGSDQLGFSYRSDGNKQNNTSYSSYSGAYVSGDILGCAYDADAGSISFYRNGSSLGTAFSGISIDQPAYFGVGKANSGATMNASVNFGQNPTFGNIAALNKNRINSSTADSVWHQSSNTGTHTDWTVSAGGTELDVAVPSGHYARIKLRSADGTIDLKKKYLLSFKYATGPANLGVQDDQGYMTAIDGSVSPNGLSSGNFYSFIVQGSSVISITGFTGSTYALDNVIVSEIDECYTDDSGRGKFHYEPPSGFLALCSDNFPTPTISEIVKSQELNLLGDEYSGSGDWLDQSSKGNDGVVNGATYNAAGYFEFDGVDDYIDFTNPGLTNEFSLEAWVRPTNFPANNAEDNGIFGTSTTSPRSQFDFNEGPTPGTNTNLRFYDSELNPPNLESTLNVSDVVNKWSHVAATRSGTTTTIYLNGSVLISGTQTGSSNSNSITKIGTASADGPQYFEGDISQSRIYSRALTPAQVFQNYHATKSKYIYEAPKITDPGEHFKAVLYEGNGSLQSVTGVGFQPDFVWIKSRSSNHGSGVFDVIRGIERLDTSATQEGRTNEGNIVISSDGFDVTSSHPTTNNSGSDMVAWCWKAGGPAVSNTDGSITTQVSANPTAGFSIVKGTQTSGTTTFGHGLGKAPKMVITKQTNGTTGWYTYHKDIGSSNTLRLDNTSASTSFAHWVTDPTTSVFSMGSGFGSGETYVAYCFAEIEGFSKFGSYVGNSSDDGTFVYCGFKPAWVMIKVITTGTTNNWYIHDSSRDSTNPSNEYLMANQSNTATVADHPLDMVSNGFKLRKGSYDGYNNSSYTYIFAAFAESPFQTANAK